MDIQILLSSFDFQPKTQAKSAFFQANHCAIFKIEKQGFYFLQTLKAKKQGFYFLQTLKAKNKDFTFYKL